MFDNQDISSYKSLSHYDCKSYKQSKKYIEKNRALMIENKIKPTGRFQDEALDWLYRPATRPAIETVDYKSEFEKWTFITGFCLLLSISGFIVFVLNVLGVL
jgi:hypothetical protein